MKKISLLVVMALLSPSIYAEDISQKFADCAIVKLDTTRLKCYDKIRDDAVKSHVAEQNKPKVLYQPIDLLDLKTDIKSLTGKKVSVTGEVQMMGDLAFIKTEAMDMTPITLNINKLPREDRKQLLKSCTALCNNATVNGTVKHGGLGDELVAEQIMWK